MNNVVLIGRLTRDPDLKYLPSGQAVSKFGLAVDKGLNKDKKQEFESKNQPTADFINIVVWGKMGENCANYLAKGRLVGVQGRYEKDGRTVYTTDVVAQNVEFLEFGEKKEAPAEDYITGFNPTDDDDIPF